MINQINLSGIARVQIPFKGKNNTKSCQQFLNNKAFNLGQDVFVKSVTSFTGKAEPEVKLSQNMADYPINQFYTLIIDKDVLKGKSVHNKAVSIYDDEEKFFKWYADKSEGKLKQKLPRIDIDGPTGCRTIWQAMQNPQERAHELIPLYIIVHDWFFNAENITDPKMLASTKTLAIKRLEKDLGVRLKEHYNKDYNYTGYLAKKKEAAEAGQIK